MGANITYKYDGDGNRVQKIVSGTKTIYFRSAAEGNVRKEFVDSGSGYAVDRVYAYLNGSHLASYSPPLGGGWKYTFRDHLGTLRVRAGGAGAVISRHDFYPFGGEHTPASPDEDHVFTDQERDAETGLDYFIARHYGNNIGRFLQPDPIAGRIADPQSLNRYSYVLNNPLRFIDPTGMLVEWADSETDENGKTDAQRKYEARIAKLRNSKKLKKRARGERLAATYKRLQDSKAVFRVVSKNASSTSSGELSYDGEVFTISLKGDAGASGAIKLNQKIAHEFEHGRQVLDGELSFQDYDQDGEWEPFMLDQNDEAKAFAAGFDAAPADLSQSDFMRGMQTQLRFGIKSAVKYLGRKHAKYKKLSTGPNNVTIRSPAIYAPPQ